MERTNRERDRALLAFLLLIGLIAVAVLGSYRPVPHGIACSCGVSVTAMGAVSKCTCRPCKCSAGAR